MREQQLTAAVTMTARELMAAADALTEVDPTMSGDEIRARLDRATPARQRARYFVAEYRRTPPRASGQRAEIIARLQRIADTEPAALHGLVIVRKGRVIRLVENPVCVQPDPSETRINSGDSDRVSITQPKPRTGGRPRKHASDHAARAVASRAYRARRKASGNAIATP
jgi:hypothetical protein